MRACAWMATNWPIRWANSVSGSSKRAPAAVAALETFAANLRRIGGAVQTALTTF